MNDLESVAKPNGAWQRCPVQDGEFTAMCRQDSSVTVPRDCALGP